MSLLTNSNEVQSTEKVINPLHLANSSEHGTPQNIIELSRQVLGHIDIDPFSSEQFNSRVKADRYFTQYDDGMTMAWFTPVSDYEGLHSSIFLNPPSKFKIKNSKGNLVQKSGAKESWNHWFTPVSDYEWRPSSIFLNPPSKLKIKNSKGNLVQKSGAKESWNHLIRQVELDHVSHAIVIAYSLEQLQVTQRGCIKSMADFPFCIASERFDYVNPEGIPQTNGSHSSAIIYVPNLVDNSIQFKELFSTVGKVLGV